ncbi:putative disease resistance protein RGA1 [Dendrobium catenatum]|uniref:putative disease resistance protein RGA1 n=1 Tax=Dendrobium catenatum TaxID=906689 RepID=UPI0010A03A5E|nr:putative disease resistance protein RGA1 [Dendrobium catenatum]
MEGTTSSIVSNLLSSLERLSQFMPIFSSIAASSSSSIAQEDVIDAEVNSIKKRLMEDLSRLSRMLHRIKAVLYDAEEREIYDKAIQLWLSELREVAYDAEDILDQYDSEAKPSLKWKQVDDDDIYGYQVSLPPSNSIKIPISCNMAMRIIEIIKKFDEIAHDRKALYLRGEDAPWKPRFNDVMKRPKSSSLVLESDVFGREEEKRKIIHLLMSHSKKESIVIPIVGMGGVGKTTLAQLDALLNKKSLLILDDVWNERADIWEALQAPFSSFGVGKIIITTRSMSVAHIMQTASPLQLECLHKEKSWLLFQRHAFYGWELDQQLDFEQLGRRIAKKCGGLPLSLKVIGGFLRNEFKEQTWKDVLNNNLWDPKEIILSALRISYNHLPSYLKPCFLYASLFPKDHYFKKLELIRMWIGQGYIQLT